MVLSPVFMGGPTSYGTVGRRAACPHAAGHLSAAAMLPGCRERRPLQRPVKHKNKIFISNLLPV